MKWWNDLFDHRSNLVAVASNLIAMASNLRRTQWVEALNVLLRLWHSSQSCRLFCSGRFPGAGNRPETTLSERRKIGASVTSSFLLLVYSTARSYVRSNARVRSSDALVTSSFLLLLVRHLLLEAMHLLLVASCEWEWIFRSFFKAADEIPLNIREFKSWDYPDHAFPKSSKIQKAYTKMFLIEISFTYSKYA